MRFAPLLCLLFLLPVLPSFELLDAHPQDIRLQVAAPISDHMVLQRGKSTEIWGTAAPGKNVSVSFASQSKQTTVDSIGLWRVKLDPLKGSKVPSELTVESAGQKIKVQDVLVGDVWMCSGQSNMAMTLARTESPDYAAADLPNVRFFKTDSKTATDPQIDCRGKWQRMTPDSSKTCSAVAYYFGKRLHEKLDVPIGLIDTSWGGKPVEAFVSMDKLRAVPSAMPLIDEWNTLTRRFDAAQAEAQFERAMEKWKVKAAEIRKKIKETGKKVRIPRRPQLKVAPPTDPNHPASIYNAKVAPWHRYAIQGAIWYQGEANRNRAVQYQPLLTALIEDWRARWNDPFPFYIAQLAAFTPASTKPGVPDAWAELQYSQTLVAQNVPSCGIAIANDIGDAKDIHPKNKKDVGNRLAAIELKRRGVAHALPCPLFVSHKHQGDKILLTFETFGSKLKSRDGSELKRFEIAGEDRVWHWAKAKIVGDDQVEASADAVPKPVAVRYAWAANPEGANLVNDSGYPASLFRTDDWPLSTLGNLTRRNPEDSAKWLVRDGFKPLFNGKDLRGWTNPYDHGQAKIVNGEIHLTGNKKFFLVTKKKYSDFELVADIKLPAGKANSGIMFRCHVQPNRVFGYQAEVDGSDRRWSGGLYDEGRRQWIWPSTTGRSKEKFLVHEENSKAFFAKPDVRDALKRDSWNRYEVICRKDHIVIYVNGVKTTDIKDDMDATGFIGLQHHGEKGQTYQFRNVYIKELELD